MIASSVVLLEYGNTSLGPLQRSITALAMLKNYLKIALRHLQRHKGYAFINVGGLALGMASCVLILLFVQDELSFDRFHEQVDEIYRVERVWLESGDVGDVTAYPVAPTLEATFPDIQRTVRFGSDPVQITRGDVSFREERFYWTDSTVFEVFSFPLLRGNPATALKTNGLVLTETMARKYFGDEDPLGQLLTVKIFDGNRLLTMEVTGVLADVPPHSHIQFDFLASMATGMEVYAQFEQEWGLNWVNTYVLLPEAYPVARIAAGMPAMIEQHLGAEAAEKTTFDLQPLTRIHLYSDAYSASKGDITYIYIFSSIAVFILLLACINFMNLATARSVQRAREVGVRKVLGALRSQLAGQFLGEAMGLAFVALLLALGLVLLLLPFFSGVTEKHLALDVFENRTLLLSLAGLTLFVGFVAGSYPALLLSQFRPLEVLKGKASSSRGAVLRKVLVVFQFTISIVLLIGTVVVHRQMTFLRERNLGFDQEQLVVISVEDRAVQAKMEPLKAELARQPGVQEITMSSEGLPSRMQNGFSVRWEGLPEEEQVGMLVVSVDEDFFDLLDLPFVEGRNFSKDFATDAAAGYILNEAAARAIGWDTAVGKPLEVGERPGTVIGVVADYHYKSLHEEIAPVVYFILPGTYRASPDNFILRIDGTNMPGTLAALKAIWEQFSEEQPFAYNFVDQAVAAQYRADERFRQVFDAFSLLAVVIACLGLFGLASFTAERRTKEIGVRKVLGASVPGIVLLLSKDFTRLVLIAFIVASPVAYFAMERWLQNFAYRIDLGVGVFLAAGVLVLAIAWLTVSYQSIRAARVNPVESLRYE
jgi:putative ABC transport system permease protein